MFRGIEEPNPAASFRIEIDLALLVQNHVPMQEGPMFCLKMLTDTLGAGPSCLDRFQSYRVVGEDFRSILDEREKRAAQKASKTPARRRFRKPPFTSNLRLGSPPMDVKRG